MSYSIYPESLEKGEIYAKVEFRLYGTPSDLIAMAKSISAAVPNIQAHLVIEEQFTPVELLDTK